MSINNPTINNIPDKLNTLEINLLKTKLMYEEILTDLEKNPLSHPSNKESLQLDNLIERAEHDLLELRAQYILSKIESLVQSRLNNTFESRFKSLINFIWSIFTPSPKKTTQLRQYNLKIINDIESRINECNQLITQLVDTRKTPKSVISCATLFLTAAVSLYAYYFDNKPNKLS